MPVPQPQPNQPHPRREPGEFLVRSVLHSWWRFSRGLTLGAQGVVENATGEILLVRHTYRPGWHFPGGGIDRGELAQAAVARELREETGIELTSPPVLFAIYSNEAFFRGDHILLYRVQHWRRMDNPPSAAHEIAEARFFPRAALPPAISPPTARRIAEIYDRVAPSGWW